MSILEESTLSTVLPMMGVFNNLVLYDQHVAQNSEQSIQPELATSWDEMALKVEGVVDGGVHAEKTLGGASRLEPLHFALSSSHRLVPAVLEQTKRYARGIRPRQAGHRPAHCAGNRRKPDCAA